MTPESAYVMFNNIPRIADANRFAALVRAPASPRLAGRAAK